MNERTNERTARSHELLLGAPELRVRDALRHEGRTGGTFAGGSVSRVARETRNEDANESVLGLERIGSRRGARASVEAPSSGGARGGDPSRAFVRVGRCRIGTNRYDRRRSVLGVAAGTHELADATLVDEDGDGDAEDGEHAEVPRGEPEAALDDLAREPVRLDELVRHHVGGRARAGHCDASGRGRGGWGRWMVGSVAGGVEPFDRARGREAGASAGGGEDARERGGSSRARGEARDALSLARGRGARTRGGVTRRARGPRGTGRRDIERGRVRCCKWRFSHERKWSTYPYVFPVSELCHVRAAAVAGILVIVRRCLLSRRAATSFLVESNDLRRPLA